MGVKLLFRDKHTKALDGAVDVPAWLWGAVKDKASIEGKSESTVIKNALKEYFSKARTDLQSNGHLPACNAQ